MLGHGGPTADLHIRYLRPPDGSPIRADPRVLRTGRRLAVVKVRVFGHSGRLAAIGTMATAPPTAASAMAVREVTKYVNGPDAEPDFSQPLPRPLSVTPLRDIATALVALAGDDARAITGATIAIDQAQTAVSLYSDSVFRALSGGWAMT